MVDHDLRRLVCCEVAPNSFDEITFRIYTEVSSGPRHPILDRPWESDKRTHQIEVDAVIHKIILSRLHSRRSTKVHPVCLARILDLVVIARQPNELWVKLLQVLLKHLGVIARGIACYHDWKEYFAALLNHLVVHERHLVELVGADVGAVREAKVYLRSRVSLQSKALRSATHQRIFAQHVIAGERIAVLIDQFEWPANFWLAHAFGLVCYPFPRHALFLICEVRP